MKRLLLCSITILLFVGRVHSQNIMFADSTIGSHPTAISFSIQGLNLGGGLMGRYWLSEKYCLRVAFDGTYHDNNTNNYWSRLIDLDISIGLTRQYSMRNNLSLYVGGFVGFGWQDYKYNSYGYPSRSLSRMYLGGAVLGIEYWLSPGISLSGEQEVRVTKTLGEQNKDYNLSSGNSKIILSAYF
jgi:hypothetical protein